MAYAELMMGAVCPLAPPPGLEELVPVLARVEVPEAAQFSQTEHFEEHFEPCYATGAFCSGEWGLQMAAAASCLSQEDAQQALSVLDMAIAFFQQAQALESVISSGMQEDSPHWQCAAEQLRAEVQAQRWQFLSEFQNLCLNGSAAQAQAMEQDFTSCLAASQAELVLSDLSPVTQPAAKKSASMVPASIPCEIQEVPELQTQLKEQTEERITAPPKQDRAANKSGINSNPKNSEQKSARPVQTLSTSLQLLSADNPDCLFIVRRISKLGFKATRTLKRHFATYGQVVRVLVAHSTVRHNGQSHQRQRPSSLGFVQMGTPEAVKNILAAGFEQDIEGASIHVQKFERHHVESSQEHEEEQFKNGKWSRSVSGGSACSLGSTTPASSGEGGRPRSTTSDDNSEDSQM